MASKYQRNTDYKLIDLSITNYEGKTLPLIDSFASIKFYESIFEPFVSGVMSGVDSYDISQYFPLLGEEVVTMSYVSDESSDRTIKNRKFRVYRAETNRSENSLTHVLHLVSFEAVVDASKSISKSYKGKTANQIVTDVYTFLESDKKFNVSETKGLHHVVVPFWSPIQTITWFSGFAQSPTYAGGTFLFFENVDGFSFVPLEQLIDTTPTNQYTAPIQNQTKSDGQTNTGNSVKTFKQLSGTTDVLKALGEGMFANTMVAYDNISKSIKTYNYSYKEKFDDTKHLNQFRLVSDQFDLIDPTQRISIVPSTLNRENSSYFKGKVGDPYSERYEETSYYRTSILSQLFARQFEIEFNGDSEITCGQLVEIEFPNNTQLDSKKNNPHKYDRKNFLLVGCTHEFTRTQYTIRSRAVSDTHITTPGYEL